MCLQISLSYNLKRREKLKGIARRLDHYRNKVFFLNKKKVIFSFHLELSETDVHQRAQEADSGQERFICAETEIIEVWDCRLGRHGYNILC